MKQLRLGKPGGNRQIASPHLLFLLAAWAVAMPLSCKAARNRESLARRTAALEQRADDDERITELKAEIRQIEGKAEKILDSARRRGTLWRLLGLKYMDHQMWGEAMKAFDEAVLILPEHALLHHNRALCAGQLAIASADADEKSRYVKEAESGYRRSLALDARYTPSMYALAVLLAFEFNRPAEAIEVLKNFLAIERSDTRARFLLARSYLAVGRRSDALEVYDDIVKLARNDEDERKARELSRQVIEGADGP